MNEFDYLICPLCKAPLEASGNTLVCRCADRRHCYDIASSGYVNLLPPGKGKNARTGDEKDMIRARSEFLDRGLYAPLSEKLGEIIADISEKNGLDCISVIDCGSGEGYHTCNMADTLVKKGIAFTALGFDASKHGAAKGAKRAKKLFNEYKNCSDSKASATVSRSSVFFGAGNIFELPVKDGSIDFAVSMFAPIGGEEMLRILKDDGYLIVLSSGENHLYELREILYDSPRESSGNVTVPDGFHTVFEDVLTYKVNVPDNKALKDLFTMTPFYYRTSLEDKKKLDRIDSADMTVEVRYTVMKKGN